MKYLFVFLNAALLNAFSDLPKSIMCKFEKVAAVEYTKYINKKKTDTKRLNMVTYENEGMSVTFGDLDKESPVMIGNGGSVKLIKSENDDGFVYLMEITESKNIVIWTYFVEDQVMIYSKQYKLFEPLGMIGIGKCKEL